MHPNPIGASFGMQSRLVSNSCTRRYRIPWPFDRFTYKFLINSKYTRLGIPNEEMEDYAICALVATVLCMVLIFIGNADFDLPKPETAAAAKAPTAAPATAAPATAAPPAAATAEAAASSAKAGQGLKQRKSAAR
jgi:hypothetical protein